MKSLCTSSVGRRKTWRSLVVLALGLGALCFHPTPGWSRDIKLGGAAPVVKKPPANMIELPAIVATKPKEGGGYQYVRVEAWLAPRDLNELVILEQQKTVISGKAKEAFPEESFEVLRAPREGSLLAKQTIRQAAEKALGHPWTGDVLIHNMLVY